ncbi:hypothetical protein HZC07_01000 [Candidatus Micrarchaeota archaeon]|nr:hypothetical protein [Candidatus Micrarchaeota archaeon]
MTFRDRQAAASGVAVGNARRMPSPASPGAATLLRFSRAVFDKGKHGTLICCSPGSGFEREASRHFLSKTGSDGNSLTFCSMDGMTILTLPTLGGGVEVTERDGVFFIKHNDCCYAFEPRK